MAGMAAPGTRPTDGPTDEVVERRPLRAVAVPSEHGGWGLTLEPIVLGLLVAPSWAGAALGLAAFTTFLARTPVKFVLVDRHRGRWLARTQLATRVALAELAVIAVLAVIAGMLGGWRWLWVVAAALPLAAIELWYDSRSRSRRLLPELLGASGVAAAAPAIALAGGRSGELAIALWLLLVARAVGSIPFVRSQIQLARRAHTDAWRSDLFQVVSIAVAASAAVIDDAARVGAVAVALLAVAQIPWARRTPASIKRLGVTQMLIGFALVVVIAVGVRAA